MIKILSIWILAFACLAGVSQPVEAAGGHCDVALPDGVQIDVRAGETVPVQYSLEGVAWHARVFCSRDRAYWRLMDGLPEYPIWAQTIAITTIDQNTRFLIFTDDKSLRALPFHENGSQIKIEIPAWGYYVARLTGKAANRTASVSYFWLGETRQGLAKLHCYNQTLEQEHRFMPTIAAIWPEQNPSLIRILCSGHGFIMEAQLRLNPELFQRVIPPEPVPSPVPNFPIF